MNCLRSLPPETDLISTATAEAHYMHTSTDVFDDEKAFSLFERKVLPYFKTSDRK